MTKEEYEEYEEETEEETEEESTPKAKTKKLELDWEMDPAERLEKEIEFTSDPNRKQIGAFLLEEFKKDAVIKNDYKAKKITLDKVFGFVYSEAGKRKRTGNCVMMSEQEVYGLVIHYIHDGEIKEEKAKKYVLTEEEKLSIEEQARQEYLEEQKRKIEDQERNKLEKAEKAKQKAIEKEKAKAEASGQMSIFDDL